MDSASSYPLVPLPSSAEQSLTRLPLDVEVLEPEADEDRDAAFRRLRQLLRLLLFLLLGVALLVRRLRQEAVLLRQQAHYWHSQHQRAKEREHQLQQQVEQLRAEIRELEKRLYGRKAETAAATTPGATTRHGPQRPKGQQRGAKGPSRRSYDHLPTAHESCTVPVAERCCATCGAPWQSLPGSDDGQILEVEVRAHRRVYHRQRYQRT